jgi:hypothetical protein
VSVVRGVYVVNLENGSMGLLEASTLRQAMRQAYREQGTDNVASVQPATKDDIEWVGAMGGWVPNAGRRSRREVAKAGA